MKFFGWRMVFTGLTLEFTVVGFLFYSFPVFWPYLISELGMTESQLGMVSAFYFIPIAILAIVVGRALDKYSVKNFMMIGAVIYAIGLFSLSFINSYWSLLTIYLTILALGSIMMGNLAVAKLISNWFDKNAGRALGIAAVGISFSGVVLPLVVDPLLDLVGWRNVYVIFASVILFIILPLIFFTVIDDPKTVNQVKDGIKKDNEEEEDEKPMKLLYPLKGDNAVEGVLDEVDAPEDRQDDNKDSIAKTITKGLTEGRRRRRKSSRKSKRKSKKRRKSRKKKSRKRRRRKSRR